MKYIMKSDSRLTEAAKNTFGDVASIAYCCYPHLRDGSPCNEDYSNIKAYAGPVNKINNGAIDICIEFTNGKIVMFTNSEWGTMRSLHNGDLIIDGN